MKPNNTRSPGLQRLLRPWYAGLVLVALLLAAQPPARAQAALGNRIGFVKLERIVKESAAAKRIQAKLAQEFSAREKDITVQDAGFKAATEKFSLSRSGLTEAQRSEHQQKLADQERELQRKQRAFQEDLNTRKNEELQKLLASTRQIIKKIAETDKFDFVMQDAVYVNPKSDITARVLKALDVQAGK